MAEVVPARTVVRVELGARSYDILIGRDLIDESGAEIARRLPGARLAIVTDETVAGLHLRRFEESLDAAGIERVAFTIAPGEASKSFRTLEKLVDELLATRLERRDAIVALGGGVVGDLSGFLAGIVRRGMRFVQVPTTLLAQVDSSVGGKTGINTAAGKNLVGMFNQPEFVLADAGILDSLSPRIFNAGYAEVAKYGLIGDPAFFAWLEANWRAVAAGWPEREHAIAVSCRAKAASVAADERDEGVRALLNFGHTFAHALETATGYTDRLFHGEAVSIGMVLAFNFSRRLGLCPPEDARRAAAHLAEVGLPTRIAAIPGPALDAATLMRHIVQDKKVTRGKLTFILTRGVGKAFIAPDISGADVTAFLEEELKQ
ncbi:MAG: 3-dehydroquinate synthase [Bauldia sp.]